VLSLSTLYPNAARPRFGTFVARQMEALAARGDWDVTMVNPIGAPPFAPGRYRAQAQAAVSGEEGGVMVHRPRFRLLPGLGGPFNPGQIARAVWPLAKRLHAAKPFDVVDAQFFYPDGPAAAAIARKLGLPLSLKARGADIQLWGHKPYALRQMLRAAERAGGLLAVCGALADDMGGLGFPREKIAVHYTGLDHTLFRPLERAECRAQLGLPPDAPILATVGALIPRKGQLYVLRAVALLPEAHLLLVGEGPDRAMLETFAGEAGLTGRVHFLGPLDQGDLPTVLSAADAMVLPSASEGLANAWIEALACGTPLVITEAGGAAEVVTSAVAGRIVARDPQAIATGVEHVLATPRYREAVAQCAARFSWEANAAALADHYERLLAT
jgi:glycosyltransferase involved in cell wall biosynthesis